MFLDTLKPRSLVFQVQYPHAYEIWDCAGSVSRRLAAVWPSLKISQAEPQRIILKAPGIDLRTEVDTAILTLRGLSTMDARTMQQIREAVDIWKDGLNLRELKRVSMRVQYTKEFPSLQQANAAVFDLGLVRWPSQKVFDQPLDGIKNGVDVTYRFEDQNTFTVLRVRAEGLIYEQETDPEFFDGATIKKEKNRMIVDFDRGTLQPIEAAKFRLEEWLKGYFHVLRRDIDKVLGVES
jgi:hypothetical protein